MPVRNPLPKAERPRAIVIGLICVALAYGAISLAFDNGSPWAYLIAFGLAIYGLHKFWHALDSYARKVVNRKKPATSE